MWDMNRRKKNSDFLFDISCPATINGKCTARFIFSTHSQFASFNNFLFERKEYLDKWILGQTCYFCISIDHSLCLNPGLNPIL